MTNATAAVLRTANGPLTLESVETGALNDDEVLVRIVGVGICHTDIGVIGAPGEGQTPIVLGHEGAGIVEEIGASVTTVAVGDRVALSYAFCGKCDVCSRGLPMHCREFIPRNLIGARIDGSTPLAADGEPVLGAWFGQSSWATHSVTTERNCVVVGDDVPLELLGPLGCGIQTGAGAVLNTLDPDPGSSIAVFAVGSVGLAAVLAAKAAGCEPIIAVDLDDARLERARELGATHTVNSSKEDPAARIVEITGGLGAQYSVDCIGLPQVVRAALECLQTPGVCASVGFQGLPNEITLDQGHLLFGRTLIGVIEGDAVPGEFIPRMLDLYREGRFPFDQLITTYPFAEINNALEDVHHAKVTKAVLTFD
ncbi:alcohol dehydrogenase [Nocardioides sp. Root190]|uniref:NAD(P)-dependent alcohol dehydrogenase n=1 Tax=Nocardioides sp. Root190 TaxID=1736488 RepID=UPI0006FBE72C|nr:NAD(P)-dependent alcohol dehydrogenase [Nocardioides sp. Root190]KRB75069.1 alcohol dehydrogenase [Nocardioides sp. Root190]